MPRNERLHSIREQLAAIEKAIGRMRQLLKTEISRHPLDEDGPLTPDQLRARSERDAKKQQRITRINRDAAIKAADIRADLGK